MENNGNKIIPPELVGIWGYYINEIPNKYFIINADGSGYLFTISHEVKWYVSKNRLGFRILNKDCPESGSAQYSIIGEKLSFSEPSLTDIGKDVFEAMMYPNLPNGLVKIHE